MLFKRIKHIKHLLLLATLFFAQTFFVNAQDTSQTLRNPLESTGTLPALIQAILNIFIIIVTPIIVFFIIYAGFLYVTGRGNPAKIQEAHKALIYAIIGGVIIIGAGTITAIVQSTVTSF